MIEKFADHVANERTFLVRARTAFAVIALGFVVEKFDLFTLGAGLPLEAAPWARIAQRLAHLAGPLGDRGDAALSTTAPPAITVFAAFLAVA